MTLQTTPDHRPMFTLRNFAPAMVLVAVASVSLAGCGGERKAKVDTGTAEAEVTTDLPKSQVSDEQLRAAAQGAAAVAETPQGSNTAVVVTPPSDAMSTGAAAPAAPAR